MPRYTPQQRSMLAARLRAKGRNNPNLIGDQRSELYRQAHNLIAANRLLSEVSKDPRRMELRRRYEPCPEPGSNFDRRLRFELSHDQMLHMADVVEGWALDSRMHGDRIRKLLDQADNLRALAEEVGEEWDPPKPERGLSIIGFLASRLSL